MKSRPVRLAVFFFDAHGDDPAVMVITQGLDGEDLSLFRLPIDIYSLSIQGEAGL
jgi:hypothetical protein